MARAARLMLERDVQRIPIVRDGRVTGIVSRRDLLRALARPDEALRAEVEELLSAQELLLGSVEVAVLGGIVCLSGLRDRASRRLAEGLSRSVAGVIAVTFPDRP